MNIYKTIFRRFDQFHWVLIFLTAPIYLFFSPAWWFAIPLLPLIWLLDLLGGNIPVHRTPLNGRILLLLVMVGVSAVVTSDIQLSAGKICGVIFGVAVFFYVCRFAKNPHALCQVYIVYLFAGFGVALLGVFATDWAVFKLPALKQFFSYLPVLGNLANIIHPNEIAGTLLWIIPATLVTAVGLLLNWQNLTTKHGSMYFWLILVASGIATIIEICVLFLTLSRTALISFAIVMSLLAGITLWKKTKPVVRAATSFLLIFFFIVAIILISNSQIFKSSFFSIDTLESRFEIWDSALVAIGDFPITGMGMNIFRSVVSELYPVISINSGIDFGHAHNEVLQAALDLGLPGAYAFISMQVITLWMLFKTTHLLLKFLSNVGKPSVINRYTLLFIITIGVFSGYVSHLIFGLVDAIALGAKPGVFLWWLQGMAAALYALVCQRSSLHGELHE